MKLNWEKLEQELKQKGIDRYAIKFFKALVECFSRNPAKFRMTTSSTASDARPLIREQYITLDKKNVISFTPKTLEILNS